MSEQGPDFLVIGTPKSGSTWLQFILASHPDIFIPGERNEIHYFDRQYGKVPPEWYQKFFSGSDGFKAIGEVTPHYLFIPDHEAFRSIPTISKFIVILRDPVARCLSHYKFRVRVDNYKGSLKEFIKDYPATLKWGLYGEHIERFLKTYDREQLLVLVYEEVTKDPEAMLAAIGAFLEVDAAGFDRKYAEQKGQ